MITLDDIIKVKTFVCLHDTDIKYTATYPGGDYFRSDTGKSYIRAYMLEQFMSGCVGPKIYFSAENNEIGVTGNIGIGNCPTGIEGLSVKENDPVNHPSHYTSGKIEVIDFIEDQKLGFCLGNTVKYVARAGKKDPGKLLEDLKKAQWYLEREIQSVINKKQDL